MSEGGGFLDKLFKRGHSRSNQESKPKELSTDSEGNTQRNPDTPESDSRESQFHRTLIEQHIKELTPEIITKLRGEIVTLDEVDWIEKLKDKHPKAILFKFVREKDRVILFPQVFPEKHHMHIDYAIADGMEDPDDGGHLSITSNSNAISLIGHSSTLNINPKNNLERPETLEIFKRHLPQSFTIKTE